MYEFTFFFSLERFHFLRNYRNKCIILVCIIYVLIIAHNIILNKTKSESKIVWHNLND